jgi:hypothetical protein
MKDLIIQALDSAFLKLESQVPLNKKKFKSLSIMDVKPTELASFMLDNNIPDTAYFDGNDNGNDGWDDILLTWEIYVPTNEDDNLKFKKNRFTDIAWRFIYKLLITSGYKRVGYNTGLLKEFNDTTVYDMYINKDFDRLVRYYSLAFVKIGK